MLFYSMLFNTGQCSEEVRQTDTLHGSRLIEGVNETHIVIHWRAKISKNANTAKGILIKLVE